MSASVVSSPIRSAGTGLGSPGFRSQRKMSAGTIMKKIQTLQDTIESLRQQLVFTRTEEEGGVQKKPKEAKEPKEKKTTVAATTEKQKKMQKTKEEEEKDKIPMPWTGQADFTTCVGLKAQYGLFIQCGKSCDSKSTSFQIDNHECRFCADCSKKCDENGKHPVGTIEERIEAGVGKYVNAKTGKKETMYIEVLEKMGITKEQALESAQKRGFQIPDWMLEKAEKKRGRPAAATATTSSNKHDSETDFKTKEKKPRQQRTKKTPASVATSDTPQKKNSAQGSVCIDLNDVNKSDDDVTPVASSTEAAAAPQEKKKRGRPAKSNTQSNIGESEMQKLIVQATTEKKKRLSIDPSEITQKDNDETIANVETQLTFESDKQHSGQSGQATTQEEDYEDMVFDMFDKIEEEEQRKKQEQQQQAVVVVTTNENKEKTKKAKNSEEKVKGEKKKNSAAAAKKNVKEEEAAALAAAAKKAEDEAAAAALKRAQEKTKKTNDEETEDEEDRSIEEEEEELECEEYEYDGEIYGLAPNGDIYSQDGDLVGKLTNGVPKMF